MSKYPAEIKEAAKKLYIQRHKPREISGLLNVPVRTIYDWIEKENWNDLFITDSVEEALNRRLVVVIAKEQKKEIDLKEIDTLTNALDRIKRNKKKHEEKPGNSKGNAPRNRRPGRGRSKIKNDVSHLTKNDFEEKLHKRYFDYQKELQRAITNRTRFLLKARQIGATWYFAQEAFEDAVLHGRNKIFLSATRAQAEVFKRYIVSIAQQEFDVELKGNPLILHTKNGLAEMHFLSNNSNSAQSYTGDVYIDEAFWIAGFNKLYKVATGMASHKKWRKTLFSTPSIVTHEAYDLWTGDRFNSRYKDKKKEFPGFKEMQSGILCPDGFWRKIITLADAEKGGCDLFDRNDLLLEYSPAEFKNLFGCEFVDDTYGVFAFADLEKCGVEIDSWKDVNFSLARPVGNRPVYGGYDPSRMRDDASFVILLPPLKPGGKFKVIKRFKWFDKTFSWQSEEIRKLTQVYNFDYIGVDVTGPGYGVYENIKHFFPQVTPIHYSPESKTEMVLKAKEVIEAKRILWDAADTAIALAFLTIKQLMTPGSGRITYAADRTKKTGHADAAFAIMHALIRERLSENSVGQSCVAFSN